VSKTTRFFEVIQMLRSARGPVLARTIAEALEVSMRTIYRDIATLQAMQIPILGEPGVGYVMRKGYDLPPINFDVDEAEAIAVGLSLIARTGDSGLWRAAGRAARKLHETAPGTRILVASSCGVENALTVDLSELRAAIRNETKLKIGYRDAVDRESNRIIWPLTLIYYVNGAMIVAWCELRHALRHFSLDRIENCTYLPDNFTGCGDKLFAKWEQTQKHETVSTKDFPFS